MYEEKTVLDMEAFSQLEYELEFREQAPYVVSLYLQSLS